MRSKLARRSLWVIGIVFVAAAGLLVGTWHPGTPKRIFPVLRPASVPYSVWGPHSVGFAPLVGDGDAPLALVAWYPAAQVSEREAATSYLYEVKFGRPVGRLAVASFEGKAILEAQPNALMGPYPLVIHSSRFSIGPNSYAWLAEHLASYGFVVLAPDHNEQFDPENELWRAAIMRPQVIRTVLAYVDEEVQAGEGPIGLIDRDSVAVIGHSFGGYTALVAAGARIDTPSFRTRCVGPPQRDEPGAWLCEKVLPHIADMADRAGLEATPEGVWPAWSIDRVDAVVSMAGNAFFFGEAGLAEINVPVMAIGGTDDADSPYRWGTYPTYSMLPARPRQGLP